MMKRVKSPKKILLRVPKIRKGSRAKYFRNGIMFIAITSSDWMEEEVEAGVADAFVGHLLGNSAFPRKASAAASDLLHSIAVAAAVVATVEASVGVEEAAVVVLHKTHRSSLEQQHWLALVVADSFVELEEEHISELQRCSLVRPSVVVKNLLM
eukprot:gb/GECG01005445.1/.p1 GENE.gb/GECG01005445.1/~~gb/GECG01005445.1/.p1  ORF type:complete len:154 (+),score=29.47 gb/GECG01005445.1/:1-462(+)